MTPPIAPEVPPAPLPALSIPDSVRAAHADLLSTQTSELAALLADRRWRLRNLYWLKPEGGGAPRRFTPRAEQELVYDHFDKFPHVPLYIIKSRRIGFSTALSILGSDKCAWQDGQNINLVDITQPDAHKKMQEQIRYAVDLLPAPILARIDFTCRNESQLSLRIHGQPDSAKSNFFAGMNARGGDCSFLWVSEWGTFANDPAGRIRSGKILAGAFPAARKGLRAVETTWMGGKSGDLWNLIKPIYESGLRNEAGTSWTGTGNADGVIMFFPWHGDPTCVSPGGELTPDVEDYFRTLAEKTNKGFSDGQKKWWAIEKTRLGVRMPQEFPSTIEEAFSAPGNAPKFSERGLNVIEKHLPTVPTQYGSLIVREEAQRAIWEPMPESEGAAWLRIWEHPAPGRSYVLAGDFCTGQEAENPDFHAVGVLRAAYYTDTGELIPTTLVAAIKPDRRTDLDVLAQQIRALQLYYGGCLVVPEINNLHGYIETLRHNHVTNIFLRTVHPDAKDDKRLIREPGWKTTTSTKPLIIEGLAALIRDEELRIHCGRVLSELRAFQIDLKALIGHHDDWVMFLAIGLHTLRLATPYIRRPPTIHQSDHLLATQDPTGAYTVPTQSDRTHLLFPSGPSHSHGPSVLS